ncbi:type VI secretion system baseplate subunit TssG [Pseudomonas fluorescens]|jgi:type VI secretion system protein ImpH|uniref:Type VI secretion system baseplate subunit TssG n=1 Tax=Pseudomonas edaphica TaxID=2006980 RepID=A0A7Y7RPR8_9PSED|nr:MULTISPECIES: type VI secretion system baseplate subunit TssG [Pseudomonas]MBD8093259.1 type VI secretion system baseplate subunit TssG [Pseudomonas fluorescens]MBD8719212.1 type VI secretion system baseplate subunit TssG [Pseudomonas fluorescens]NMX56272.1 type VI secretion system baseplate subunit TssG [Pseudomonas sp. WS 5146]NVZ55858.1 type VI secretion system baseplate subunit TssG [Pseudomonas edaphica]
MHDLVTRLPALSKWPWRYEFFSAMRSIESAYPQMPRWGTADHLRDDPVRLAQQVSLAFQPAMIAGWRLREGQAACLLVNFFGLTGVNGPMPLHFSERLLSLQVNHNDPAAAHFLDVFHHRLLSLLYRSWAMARPVVSADRPAQDRFCDYVSAFSPGQMSALPGAASYYASQMVDQRRNARGLLAMVSDFLHMPVSVQTLVGRRAALEPGQRLSLGRRHESSQLGVATLLGRHAWNVQHSFTLQLGPLSWCDYQRLLPAAEFLLPLYQLVERYVGPIFQWSLELQLDPAQVVHLRLGNRLPLGQATWLAAAGDPRRHRYWRFTPARFFSD